MERGDLIKAMQKAAEKSKSASGAEAPIFEFGREELNPLTSKGLIRYRSFVLSVLCIAVFNFAVYGVFHEQLLPLRALANRDRLIVVYGLWFLFSTLGFAMMSNTLLKRWRSVWGSSNLPGVIPLMLRMAILSPLGCGFAILISLLTTSKIPLFNGDADEPERNIVLGWILVLGLSAFVALAVPASWLGMVAPRFSESMQAVVKRPLPVPDSVTRPLTALVSPGVRYVIWLVGDFFRARDLERVIQAAPQSVCQQRRGYIGLPVQDCYFAAFRRLAAVSPFAGPYFGLFFEARYRQSAGRDTLVRAENEALPPEIALAQALLAISNQLEFLEKSEIFLDRRSFLEPAFFLRMFGSPDIPIVEAGQDIGRLSIAGKFLPVLEMQLDAVEVQFKAIAPDIGGKAIDFQSAFRDLNLRLRELKARPLIL